MYRYTVSMSSWPEPITNEDTTLNVNQNVQESPKTTTSELSILLHNVCTHHFLWLRHIRLERYCGGRGSIVIRIRWRRFIFKLHIHEHIFSTRKRIITKRIDSNFWIRFTQRLIGRRSVVEWPARSSVLITQTFFLWRNLMAAVGIELTSHILGKSSKRKSLKCLNIRFIHLKDSTLLPDVCKESLII